MGARRNRGSRPAAAPLIRLRDAGAPALCCPLRAGKVSIPQGREDVAHSKLPKPTPGAPEPGQAGRAREAACEPAPRLCALHTAAPRPPPPRNRPAPPPAASSRFRPPPCGPGAPGRSRLCGQTVWAGGCHRPPGGWGPGRAPAPAPPARPAAPPQGMRPASSSFPPPPAGPPSLSRGPGKRRPLGSPPPGPPDIPGIAAHNCTFPGQETSPAEQRGPPGRAVARPPGPQPSPAPAPCGARLPLRRARCPAARRPRRQVRGRPHPKFSVPGSRRALLAAGEGNGLPFPPARAAPLRPASR